MHYTDYRHGGHAPYDRQNGGTLRQNNCYLGCLLWSGAKRQNLTEEHSIEFLAEVQRIIYPKDNALFLFEYILHSNISLSFSISKGGKHHETR